MIKAPIDFRPGDIVVGERVIGRPSREFRKRVKPELVLSIPAWNNDNVAVSCFVMREGQIMMLYWSSFYHYTVE